MTKKSGNDFYHSEIKAVAERSPGRAKRGTKSFETSNSLETEPTACSPIKNLLLRKELQINSVAHNLVAAIRRMKMISAVGRR